MIPIPRPASSTIAPVPDVDLKPTAEMASNAKRGLELRRKHGKGGTAVGVARARDLARRANLSPDTVRRMHSFFSRHEGNQAGGEDDAGYIAWLLWGGDAGKGWAERKTKELDKETAMRSDTYKAIASRLGMAARPAAKAAMSKASDVLDFIKRSIASGQTVYVQTAMRTTKVTPSVYAKWEATGKPLFKLGKDGDLLMASGSSYVRLTSGDQLLVRVAARP
jgi:hypothetical protein